MPNANAKNHERLSSHKFDTSNYIVMDMKVKRDTKTGRLSPKKVSEKKKQKELA